MTEDSDAADDASSLSRREFALGGVGVLALGGAGAYLSTSGSGSSESTYVLQQGYLRWEVDPLSHEDATVEEFYDYQTRSSSASPAVDVASEPAASRVFLYAGPVGTSLVFLHGSPEVDHGGTAFLKFSGLSRSAGEWAVRDDPMGTDDDFEKWEGGNAKVKWQWDANTTDGGAFWGVEDAQTITITPKTLQGVDAWRFLTGDPGNATAFDLSTEKPAKLKPADGRAVKRANVAIMPDEDPNEFDPYAKSTLTVVVKQPPEGADASEWVDPSDVDPGNYSVYFGSKDYLAGQNGASPQKYFRQDGDLYLQYKTKSAQFSLDSAYGYLVGKTGSNTWFRGRDTVRPGGFDNTEREPSQLVVTDLNVDPEGGDREHLASEYVEFTNDGDDPLDMTGYTVVDAEGWEFHLPDGFTLEAGASFRLHTGEGEWDEDDLYWGLDTPVWGNDGDTVRVRDAEGELVLEYGYPRT
ncbi:lamin tail domain-containing protein [Halarchaeum sp. CBA1220]|uniref:lamin tail domain-containing protein n=1 Tax=Halarchaeum sp. CBA1220 TaxID=1853682 RepID=UPI000F3A8EE4|nr:lamin tail domain-containing protein [Halarchaeum sp. CBA1220]QLC34370.1 lamin tail domain-containing protein [Halarchaeum sp. CBA1220]